MGNCFSFWEKKEVPFLRTCYWCKGRFNEDDLEKTRTIVLLGDPVFCIRCRIKLGDISINTI